MKLKKREGGLVSFLVMVHTHIQKGYKNKKKGKGPTGCQTKYKNTKLSFFSHQLTTAKNSFQLDAQKRGRIVLSLFQQNALE
jgi:hypothetical protein